MRKLVLPSALLLSHLLTGCSILGIGIDEPSLSPPNALCQHLTIVRPSRTLDKLSEETARGLASNNAVIQSSCSEPPKFASTLVRA